MADQILVNVISSTSLGSNATATVAHGLKSNGKSVSPKLVQPEKGTSIIVVDVDDTYVYFRNDGTAADEAKFRVERGLSNEVDAEALEPLLWKGSFGDGTGTVQTINTGAGLTGGPITTTGTISAVFGSAAGTVCEGNDARLSNTRVPTPLSPSPAGTFGSSSLVPVVTVNSAGQVTSVTTQAVATVTNRVVSVGGVGGSGGVTSSSAVPIAGLSAFAPYSILANRRFLIQATFGEFILTNSGPSEAVCRMFLSVNGAFFGSSVLPFDRQYRIAAGSTFQPPDIEKWYITQGTSNITSIQLSLIATTSQTFLYSIAALQLSIFY